MPDEPLRYLSTADVLAALPDIEERLRLAEQTMRGLVAGAQLPPKIGVHPAAPGSFAHAMPALLPGSAGTGGVDLLGMKWVVGYPGNLSQGLPAVHGTTILSDGRTGRPRAILDAGALTAHRTAAVSGLALRHWGPAPAEATTVAIIGAGVQARSHLPVISRLLPRSRLVLCDVDRARAEALASEISGATSGLGRFAEVQLAEQPADAAADADVVLTMVSFGPAHQGLPPEAFARASLVVAVDYDMCVPAAVARDASLFLVDDRLQYLATRSDTTFVGYPEDPVMLGEAIEAPFARPAGPVVVTHLGVGLADIVFGDAVLRVAASQGIGTILVR
jgi:ornithine cyclodeaminase/alanine dehydrogenase-like protein (mu-crystallin family)